MTFQGFPRETLSFLAGLRAKNTKEWFEAHRDDYERLFVAPALDLIATMAPVVEALDPPHKAEAKINKSLRRIHRDTRFSKDKTPYNTAIHMVFWAGDHPNRSAGIHLVLGHDHFGYGAGHWAFDGAALERYRAAVLDNVKRAELEGALKAAEKIGCRLGEPELKRPPKDFAEAPAHGDLLRRKGIVSRTYDMAPPDDRLFSPEAHGYLAGLIGTLAPIDRWIRENVETG